MGVEFSGHVTGRTDPLPPEVHAALQRGETIEAIRLLRDATGLGLKEAKDLVDRHRRGQPTSPAPTSRPTSLPPDVVAAMQQGRKLEAIRLLREQTGLGLAESKAAVESLEHSAGGRFGPGAPGEVPRSSGRSWLAVIFVGVAALVYYFSRSSG